MFRFAGRRRLQVVVLFVVKLKFHPTEIERFNRNGTFESASRASDLKVIVNNRPVEIQFDLLGTNEFNESVLSPD